jgi:hypothetical protein
VTSTRVRDRQGGESANLNEIVQYHATFTLLKIRFEAPAEIFSEVSRQNIATSYFVSLTALMLAGVMDI